MTKSIFSDFAKSQNRDTTKAHRKLFVISPKLHDNLGARVSQIHYGWLKLNEKCLNLHFDNEIKFCLLLFELVKVAHLSQGWCAVSSHEISLNELEIFTLTVKELRTTELQNNLRQSAPLKVLLIAGLIDGL